MLINRIPILTRLDDYPRTSLITIGSRAGRTEEGPAVDFWPSTKPTPTRILKGFTILFQHSEQRRNEKRFWAVELWKIQFICGMSSRKFKHNVVHTFLLRLPHKHAMIVEMCGSLDSGGQPIIS